MTGSVLYSGGNVIVLSSYVLISQTAPIAVAPVHDGGDGISPQELAALKRHLKQAKESQRKSDEKKRRAEKLLDDAIEAARVKLFGEAPVTALPRLRTAVEVARPVVADNAPERLAGLQRAISEALTLIATIEAEQQEDEDDVMLLLAA